MSAECSQHGIHLVGMEDAYCPLCRCSELQAENERLREALERIEEGTRPGAATEVEALDQVTLKRSAIHRIANSAPSGESDG